MSRDEDSDRRAPYPSNVTRDGCSAGGNFMVQVGRVDCIGYEQTTTFENSVVSWIDRHERFFVAFSGSVEKILFDPFDSNMIWSHKRNFCYLNCTCSIDFIVL